MAELRVIGGDVFDHEFLFGVYEPESCVRGVEGRQLAGGRCDVESLVHGSCVFVSD